MNIYVGNLSWGLKDQDLANLFSPFGEVASAKIVMDKFTQRSKGFGFVEMPNDEQAQAAIAQLNGSEIDGRNLVVNESRPKEGGDGGYKKEALAVAAAAAALKKAAAAAVDSAVVMVAAAAAVTTVAAAVADTEIIINILIP
jgi:RNA recognition motif-containing protein